MRLLGGEQVLEKSRVVTHEQLKDTRSGSNTLCQETV